MIFIDSNVRSTFDFKFSPAVSRAEPCAVYRMEDTFSLDGENGFKGDWLVKQGGKLKLVRNMDFQGHYATRDIRAKTEKKRLPVVAAGDVVDAETIKVGARGLTNIRKGKESSVYFVDDVDNLLNREETPFVYLSLHCPYTEPGVTSGAYVEDVIDILIDHIETARNKRNSRGVSDVQMALYAARQAVLRVGSVVVPEDRLPDKKGNDWKPASKPCCGGKEK